MGCSVEWPITDGGLWFPEEATHHISYLELIATFLAIKVFGKAWQNIAVLLQMDNITTVSYINQKRGDSLTTTASVIPDNFDLVCRKEYNFLSRASFRPPEPTGLLGILQQPTGLLSLGIFLMIIILDHTTLFFTLIVIRTDLVSNIIS